MMLAIFSTIYSSLLLPPLLYLLCISLAGIKTPRRLEGESVKGTIGVLVPAHNEKLTIVRTIDSITSAANQSDDIEVTVIADNCSDNTAELAKKLGVNVLERHNPHLRGKGAALQWAMAKLSQKNYDYIMVVDADSIVNPEFFQQLRLALGQKNTGVVQARYEAIANEHSGIKRLAMLGFNVLRGRGRVALGGSAGIMGNGFIMAKDTLERAPFHANSIVEDLEYHLRLIEADIAVAFCDGARIYGEMPSNDKAHDVQASRWEGGRLGVLKAAFFPLLFKSITGLLHGRWHALDALLDLMLLPIGYLVIIVVIGLLFSSTQAVAMFGLLVIVVYVCGAAKCGNGWRELLVLTKVPAFLWRKLLRIPALFAAASANTHWEKTPRDKK